MFNLNSFEQFANQHDLRQCNPFVSGKSYKLDSSGGGAVSAPGCISSESSALPESGDFPLEALPPIIRNYAQELASSLRLPLELPALCAVAALSGALGKGWKAVNATNERTTGGNLYVVLSLPSGAGKSVANRISDPIHKIERERARQWKETDAARLESELHALEAEIAKLKRPQNGHAINRGALQSKVEQLASVKRKLYYSPSLTTGNATTSGLAWELSRVRKETLWVYSAEGGEVFRVMLGVFRKEGTDMDLWLSGYSGEPYKQTRAGLANTVSLATPCLSALVMVQPVVLEEVLTNPLARERGLMARMLLVGIDVPPVPDDGVLRRVDSEIEQAWADLIAQVLSLRFDAIQERELECSREAAEVFRVLNNTAMGWAGEKYADFRAELSRWRENAIRLAVVLQVASNPRSTEISPTIAQDAVSLFRWIGLGALELLARDRDEKIRERAADLTNALKRHGGSCLASELQKRNGISLAEVRQLVGSNPEQFKIEETTGNGRPGTRITLING